VLSAVFQATNLYENEFKTASFTALSSLNSNFDKILSSIHPLKSSFPLPAVSSIQEKFFSDSTNNKSGTSGFLS